MKILAIETSCDETAAAVVEQEDDNINVLSNVISSQIEIHQKYGGIVPEVAAREHVLNIIPVINEALKKAEITSETAANELTALAVTTGPGLITSLMIGVEATKTLSFAWKLPIVSVNHIEGHIFANTISNNHIQFPAIVLTVSGGHTMLIFAEKEGKYKTIGDTRDDAAGEAFDKAAQLMGLVFPGGPEISKQAELAKPNEIKLPRPMINDKSFDFSFSGLKTALLYQLKKDKKWKTRIPEYAQEFENAVVDVLVSKAIKAAKKYNAKTLLLSGGVSANKHLRDELSKRAKAEIKNIKTIIPDLKYTTDNAVMIGVAALFHARNNNYTLWQKLKADCNSKL